MKTRSRARKPQKVARRPLKKRRRWSRKHLAKGPATILIRDGKIAMVIPRRMKSPNRRGGWHEARGDRMAWEGLLRTASIDSDGSVKLPVTTRMKVSFCRLTPSQRWILDSDNLASSAKRLLDSLKACGWIVDDCATWLSGPTFSQAISTDKCYYALVNLEPCEAYDHSSMLTVDPRTFLKDVLKDSQFVVTAENLGPPLTVAGIIDKYGLSPADVRAVEQVVGRAA